jgi:hypothetical protein
LSIIPTAPVDASLTVGNGRLPSALTNGRLRGLSPAVARGDGPPSSVGGCSCGVGQVLSFQP